jgi:hypothetical protein
MVKLTLAVASDDVQKLPSAVLRQEFGHVVVAGVPLLQVCR